VRLPGTSKLVDESHAYQTAAVVAFSSYLLSTASTLAGEIRLALEHITRSCALLGHL
jgi:hypothetical protein